MKQTIGLLMMVVLLSACNNREEMAKLQAQRDKDSTMLVQAKEKDSIISSYVNTLGSIQDNLDSLKAKEKILTERTSENKESVGASVMNDIKSIDSAIILSNKKIALLESLLRKSRHKDAGLEKLVAQLNKDIAEKNDQITYLQNKITESDKTMSMLTNQFNDSINEIKNQREKYMTLNNQYNTVYYLTGTMKELKDKGAISKKGGILGIGSAAQLSSDASKANFTKADRTQLHAIALNGKFSKVVTSHPQSSYRISGDSLLITDPSSFWSESKYLVVQTK